MSDRIRIMKHEAISKCGSFEIRFPDGRESIYFYWDDLPSGRLRPETLDRETALMKSFSRGVRKSYRVFSPRKVTAATAGVSKLFDDRYSMKSRPLTNNTAAKTTATIAVAS